MTYRYKGPVAMQHVATLSEKSQEGNNDRSHVRDPLKGVGYSTESELVL